MQNLTLTVLPQALAVCQIPPTDPIPEHLDQLPFWSLTRTAAEISLVVPESAARPGWIVSAPWRGLEVEGPLDFTLVGILAAISSALANAGISLFALSTFNTDYILVKGANLGEAIQVLTAQGYIIKMGPSA